jgi:hypothetical protein
MRTIVSATFWGLLFGTCASLFCIPLTWWMMRAMSVSVSVVVWISLVLVFALASYTTSDYERSRLNSYDAW